LGSFHAFDVGAANSNPATFVNSHGGCQWMSINSTCKVSWANGFHSGNAFSTNIRCIVDHFSGNGLVVFINSSSGPIPASQAVNKTFIYYELGSGPDTRSCELVSASGDSFHVGTQWF
jgi:hypothetical protein